MTSEKVSQNSEYECLNEKLLLEVEYLRGAVKSALKWQKRSWIKRLFYKWRPPEKTRDFSENKEFDRDILRSSIKSSGLFSTEYYIRKYPDVARLRITPLEHYISCGRHEGRSPSALFDPHEYAKANLDLQSIPLGDLLPHFIEKGRSEGRLLRPPVSYDDIHRTMILGSNLFDVKYYAKRNPDVVAAGFNLFEHYFIHGRHEGRMPCSLFDPKLYLAANPDINQEVGDCILHYISIGVYEERRLRPGISPKLAWRPSVEWLSASGMKALCERNRWPNTRSKMVIYFLDRILPWWVKLIYKQETYYYTITNPERIGHLASESEIFFSEVELGIHPKGRYYLVLDKKAYIQDVGWISIEEKIKDSYLLKMIKNYRPVFIIDMDDAGPVIDRFVKRRNHRQRDVNGVLDRAKSRLRHTSRENSRGWKEVRSLGLTPNTPFVCLHLREPGYLQKLYEVKIPDARYAYRDVSPDSYLPAVEYLIQQGYKVVQMGVPPVTRCSLSSSHYIDYANRCQSPFLDLFLCSKSSIFIGTTSGLYAVADLFRKPTLYTNFAPLRHIHSWSEMYLTVPKVAYYERLGRLLTFEEMVVPGFGDVIHGEKFEQLGITYIANTGEEILEGTKEVVGRSRKKWDETAEDRLLQKRFWDVIPRDELNKVVGARVGAHFLNKYKELLPRIPVLADRVTS